MVNNRNLRIIVTAITLVSAADLVAQNQPSVFYFGGKRIFVGMAQTEALAALSTCCKLSPPTVTEAQRQTAAEMGRTVGQLILPKEESQFRILGTIFFGHGKVTNVTRPLGEEAYLPWSEDVLGFARTLQRALSPGTGDSDTTIHLSIRHERMNNGESEVLSITFPNGRGTRIILISVGKASEGAPPESREQANLEEFLEPGP